MLSVTAWNVSSPYFSTTALSSRSPTVQAPIIAFTSSATMSSLTLPKIRSQTSSRTLPASWIFTAVSRSASCHRSWA